MRFDLFCRVIDNYGDIGVCWRLARQLAEEHRTPVRLWVDDLRSLQPLLPASDPASRAQLLHGVEIRQWADEFTSHWDAAAPDAVGDVVIEAFACELPPAFVAAMAKRSRPPAWINLEYLSAESWTEDCHGLASPHPSLALTKHFFFPGFGERSGGLLREGNLLARRDAMQAGLSEDAHGRPLEISLFCYEHAPLSDWLQALAAAGQPTRIHVAAGKPQTALRTLLGKAADDPGPWSWGPLELIPLPFLAQADYDALLWRCDLNCIRGEDSFVRAQWAARPLLWHIYAQAENAHLDKLTAFLDRYTAGLSPAAAAATRALHLAWNGEQLPCEIWPDYLQHWPELREHARKWAADLSQKDDLATRLVKFVAGKV
ncbi:elongation factor P maturation arginine rhamnosyltransferase EarP [Dechloromonas sp. ZY10]|uniref:elongation factor P maturation arginine rhamnosyltransferase EarP n=1 Tax=Dechloromonas aquae TaxID=2664436 RepID=UPI003529892B